MQIDATVTDTAGTGDVGKGCSVAAQDEMGVLALDLKCSLLFAGLKARDLYPDPPFLLLQSENIRNPSEKEKNREL